MASLSVFYIVRNEQEYIYKSIKSIESVADEIIIIDTGSIDRTIDICKAFNSKIYKYKWTDNFSEVRNFGLSKCSKDYVFYINADEIISAEDCKKIKKILENPKKAAYNFKIQDCLGDWEWGEFSKLSKNYSYSPQIRMFPNKKNILFDGNVFESVNKSIDNLSNCLILNSDITIYHHVFRGNPSQYKKKKEDYYKDLAKKEEHKQEINRMSQYQLNDDQMYGNEKCAIIIVSFNISSITKRCIDSIRRNTFYPYKIILVDNGSDSKTINYLESVEDVELIKLPNNTGVSHARNLGIKKAFELDDIKYICLLDNDTEVYNDWLKNMILHLNSNEDVGMVGPITTNAVGSQSVVKTSWVGRKTVDEIISMSLNRGTKYFQEVNYLNRFCQVFRKDLVKKVGFLDEEFGIIGWEDQDFCRRILNFGLKLNVLKNVFVYHKGHASSAYNGMSYNDLIQQSAKNYHKKWNTESKRHSGNSYGERIEDQKQIHPPTSIVVLTYNNLNINKRFVSAIKKYTKNYELIVVDNGSSDGTIKYLESLGDSIVLIKNGKNLGIPKARNIGLRQSSYDYMICLDNDQIVRENWLSSLHDIMVNGNYDFVGVEAWKVDENHMPILRYVNPVSDMKIDYVGAGGCLMKRSVLEDIGIYDERFSPAYFEDVDICYRAREEGYSIGWCHSPIINHLEHSTLIKSQKDFSYNQVLANSSNIFRNKVREKSNGVIFKECHLDSLEKTVTFCMCLKNRSKRALMSIRSLVNEKSIKRFNFIVVEDIGEDMLNLDCFEFKDYIDHYIVDSGTKWSRAKLLNYGLKRTETKYVAFWDADFIFDDNFIDSFYKMTRISPLNTVFDIASFESDNCIINGKTFYKGDRYGSIWAYPTDLSKAINGFDEQFIGWGREERDYFNRFIEANKGAKVIRTHKNKNLPYLRITHMSHSDSSRGISLFELNNNDYIRDFNLNNRNIIVNANGWGELKTIGKNMGNKSNKKNNNSDTIIVMGNGPSLKDVDFEQLRGYNTFGMNCAYRHWRKIGWWPTYYGCFDLIVTNSHSDSLKKLIEDPNVKIKKFFLLKELSKSDKLKVLKFRSQKIGDFSKDLSSFGYGGNTGVNCCQVAACLGFKKIILVGVDGEYVDIVDGAKTVDLDGQKRLIMEKTPDKNPNYFIDDYNIKGDIYNIPRSSQFMIPAWEAFAKFAKKNGIEVVNCSPKSKLNCFPKSTLEKELGFYEKKDININTGIKFKKDMCILEVAQKEPSDHHKELFKNNSLCDYYYVTWGEDVEGSLKYCPKTSWGETRNILAEKVSRDYRYYCFIDDDVELICSTKRHVVQELNNFLLHFNPSVGVPYNFSRGFLGYDKTLVDKSKQWSPAGLMHNQFVCIHHSIMNYIFPLSVQFGGFWDTAGFFSLMATVPFQDTNICSYKILAKNLQSRLYEQNKATGNALEKMALCYRWIKPAFKQGVFWSDSVQELKNHYDSNRKVIAVKQSDLNVNHGDLGHLEKFLNFDHEFFKNKNFGATK